MLFISLVCGVTNNGVRNKCIKTLVRTPEGPNTRVNTSRSRTTDIPMSHLDHTQPDILENLPPSYETAIANTNLRFVPDGGETDNNELSPPSYESVIQGTAELPLDTGVMYMSESRSSSHCQTREIYNEEIRLPKQGGEIHPDEYRFPQQDGGIYPQEDKVFQQGGEIHPKEYSVTLLLRLKQTQQIL